MRILKAAALVVWMGPRIDGGRKGAAHGSTARGGQTIGLESKYPVDALGWNYSFLWLELRCC